MFGIGSVELLVVAIAALLFVGPKELPTAMRAVGRFVGKVRAYTRHFTAGIDAVVREAELEEMEKQWKAQNEAIMAEFPSDMYAETMLPKREGGEESPADEDKPASAPRPKAGPDGEPELP
ncbi:Sec-independent protein translocase protein TatB [Sphingomicrobium sp. XHP0235]|uniref:Sec-independent protein translocase protein TatB n=1 Tax=Sphingomicrobium aquimarinum TaxID=3133971 RepID=UPI0031FE6AAD